MAQGELFDEHIVDDKEEEIEEEIEVEIDLEGELVSALEEFRKVRREYKKYKNVVAKEQELLIKSLEESKKTIFNLKIQLEEEKKMYEVTKSDLERKDKEYQQLEEDIVSLRKELEKCKNELNMRIKYDGSTEALDKMLSKKKHSKDIESLGFEAGQSSNGKDSSNKEILFTSSSGSEVKQTFTVSKPNEKKTYVVATKSQSRNQHADPKGKSKMDDGGFTRVKDMRKSSKRLSYATPRRPMRKNFNNDWYVPQFHGYYYKCNTYGHRIAECRLVHRSPPSFESRYKFGTLRNMNFVCYHCNEYVHRSYECRRTMSQSYNRFLNSSFNENVKCYHCHNLGHIAKHCKFRTTKQMKTVSTSKPNAK